jgi:putative ABC transport system ATP-binding protein
MNYVLEAANINKIFELSEVNSSHILKDIDLAVRPGEFVAVMGASGSGKSTLLYNISGMDRMTSGQVVWDERELSQLSEPDLAKLRLNEMGFVFQQAPLLKNLSILDNIMLPGVLAKKGSRKKIKQKALLLMERTGISHLAERDITQASGGELQRVSICRALINDPGILFGDEPTGALNSSSSNEIMNLLSSINTSGTTILLVTHDIKVAAKAERVVFMLDGRIVSEKVLGKWDVDRAEDVQKKTIKHREAALFDWLNSFGY